MSIELKELKEKRNSLLMQMQGVAMHKSGWNADRRSQFDKMNADVTALEADIQRSESMAGYDKSQAEFTRSARPGISGTGGSGEEKRDRINTAFRSYARTGRIAEEHRDLLTTSDATGGALIPQDFYPELVNALKFYGPIASKVKQRVTDNSGVPLKVSLGNDTTHGLVLLATEGTPRQTSRRTSR